MKLHDSAFLKRNGNIELPSVFSRLNAGGVYLKLSLETQRLFEPSVYSEPGVYLLYLLSGLFNHLFLSSVLEVY